MHDELGNRMKDYYENRYRFSLPRRGYAIIRIDGKAFHSYTKGLKRPFDEQFIDDMDITACYLCKNIMGAKFGFVQSDEISIILTDFDQITTEAWFGNNLQKMCSVSASLATVAFNRARLDRYKDIDMKWAEFDSRVFQIPQHTEVCNYFIWRQQDATRNSIQSVAQSLYSQKELHGKNINEQQEMIFARGINWNDYVPKFKRGRGIIKIEYQKEGVVRSKWKSVDVPVFTQNREFLNSIIPFSEK